MPFYAIKSNPIQPLIEDIFNLNCGFDCASKNEIKTALKLGAQPENIVYSNSIKLDEYIKYAKKQNVLLTTADTFDELAKIQKVAPQMKILWRLSFQEDVQANMACTFSTKFGDDLRSLEEVKDRFQKIKNMGIKLEGVHFHCGSGHNGAQNFEKAIEIAKTCMKLGREIGHNMNIIDIGGGLPPTDLPVELIQKLEKLKNDPLGYRVIAEPGRHFSQNTGHLVTRVIGKRNKKGRICYHINDSLYHSFNNIIMDGVTFEDQNNQFYSMLNQSADQNENIAENFKKLKFQQGSIFGMTCDGLDIIAKNISLPEMNVGDYLVFNGFGSYTVGPKSQFNGMTCQNKIVIWNDKSALIEEDTNSRDEINSLPQHGLRQLKNKKLDQN